MPTFEVAPRMAYTGSFQDYIISGSLVVTASRTGTQGVVVVQTGQGIVVASNVSASFPNLLRSQTKFGRFSTISASMKYGRGDVRNSQFFENSTFYYDSFVPSIDDVMRAETQGLLLTNYANLTTPVIKLQYIFSGYGRKTDGTYAILGVTTSTGGSDKDVPLANNSWVFSFPFQRRYASASRLANNPINKTTALYAYSASFRIDLTVVGGASDPVLNKSIDGPFSGSTIDNGFGQGFTTIGINNPTSFGGNFNVAFMESYFYSTGSYPRVVSLEDGYLTGTVNTSYQFSNTPPSYYVPTTNDMNALQVRNAETREILMHTYGIGDNVNNRAEFASPLSTSITITGIIPRSFEYAHTSRFGAKVRGWKFGLYSAFATSPKVVYRASKFGHFRDRLEQRLLGAEQRTVPKLTTTYPVTINFLSGSEMWLTASNSNLNVRESGIYDVNYRRGKPYGGV